MQWMSVRRRSRNCTFGWTAEGSRKRFFQGVNQNRGRARLTGMRKILGFSLIILPSLLGVLPAADAAEASAELRVSATVIARAIADVQTAPETLEITEEDVRRGWVEAEQTSRVRIRSNDRNGYRMVFRVLGAPVRAIQVKGLGDDSTLGLRDGEGSLTRPHSGRFATTADLTFRFLLDEDAAPGIYAWPLTIQASPI